MISPPSSLGRMRMLMLFLRRLSIALFLIFATVGVSGTAAAQSRGEDEARRQLEFAKEEVVEGNFEKALASADSALRLFPALYEAYVYKALAYEGLGKLKMAESFLLTYIELKGTTEDLDADDALARIQEKLGQQGQDPGPGDTDPDGATGDGGSSAATTSPIDVADMPDFPRGSEEFLRWMVLRQQIDTFETRKNLGAGLTVGGVVLAGVGAGLIVSMSLASAGDPNNANIESVYAAGIATTMTGGTLFVIGLPTLAVNAGKLKKLDSATASLRPRPRFEIGGSAVALRF